MKRASASLRTSCSIWTRTDPASAEARELAIRQWDAMPPVIDPPTSDSPASVTAPMVGPVLLVTPWYRPIVGGVVEVADRLFRTLSQAGVHTLLLVCDTHRSGQPEGPNLHYMTIPCGAFCHGTLKSVIGMHVRGLLTGARLLRLIRRNRIRTLVLIYPNEHSWLLLALRRLLRLRLIVSCHGSDLWNVEERIRPMQRLLRRVLHAADAITVCANHLAAKAKFLSRERPRPICLIHNSVNTNYFTPPPQNFRREHVGFTLVHVSNFAPKKRVMDILDAFARAQLPSDARLLMVGEGRQFEQAVARARELQIHSRTTFVGNTHDVRPYLWQSDLFVISSEEESGPLALLEAMSCELPFVATPGGIASRLPENECGLMVPPGRPDLLAGAIESLFAEPQRRHSMGRRGRECVQDQYSEDTYLRKHLNLIRQVELQGVPPYRVTLPVQLGAVKPQEVQP